MVSKYWKPSFFIFKQDILNTHQNNTWLSGLIYLSIFDYNANKNKDKNYNNFTRLSCSLTFFEK